MRKLVFLLFPILATAILGCSNNDDMPCATCDDQYYCRYYIGGGSYSCRYMSVSDCNRYNGDIYSDPTCGGYVYVSPSSSSRPGSSSSSRQSGVIHGASVTYGNETYETVVIGSQTWMARNLNYNASGSRCYGDSTGGDSHGNCAKYGRLYDWATAMGISSSYNSSYYNPSSSTKYRGVCPSGWHIPNNAEWDKLMRYADGTSGTSSPYDSPTAGRYLKATEGWNSCGNGSSYSYRCEDAFGFSALPGGDGYSGGSFYSVGINGYWWSASEIYSNSAYIRRMNYDIESAYYDLSAKSYLYSVRCLQD